jgi:hypothetical protein
MNSIIALSLVLFSFTSNVSKHKLFNIERSKDKNEIVYEVNYLSNGTLNLEEPVKSYWIKHESNDKVEPLTWIQRNYAYGLKFITKDKNQVTFQFVSYNKRTFTLKKDHSNQYKVYVNSNGKEVELKKIFIQIDGGTFWVPNVSRIELHSFDYRIKKQEIEIINPLQT